MKSHRGILLKFHLSTVALSLLNIPWESYIGSWLKVIQYLIFPLAIMIMIYDLHVDVKGSLQTVE